MLPLTSQMERELSSSHCGRHAGIPRKPRAPFSTLSITLRVASQREIGAGKLSASMRRETTISYGCSSHASGFMELSMMDSRKQQLTTML